MPHLPGPPTQVRAPAFPGIPETCPPGEGMLLFLRLCVASLFAVPLPGPAAGRAATGTGRRPHAPAPQAPGIGQSPDSGAAGAALNKYGKSNHAVGEECFDR